MGIDRRNRDLLVRGVLVPNGSGGGGSSEPLNIASAGNWIRSLQTFSVGAGTFSFYPSGTSVSGNGAWVQELNFYESNDPGGLTSLNFTNLAGTVEGLDIDSFSELESLSFPSLVAVGDDLSIGYLDVCETISLPALRAVGGSINMTELATESLNLPNLEMSESLYVNGASQLSAVTLPKLSKVVTLYFSGCNVLTELTFPVLKEVSYFEVGHSENLTSVSFSALEKLGNVTVQQSNMPNLQNWSYGPSLTSVTGNQNFNNATFDQSSVDHILTTLVGIESFSNDVNIGEDNAIPSPAGFAAAITMSERGNYVEFNAPVEIPITMTAGPDGYGRSGGGSVAENYVGPYLVSIRSTSILIDDVPILWGTVNNKSVYINDVEQPGEWSEGDFIGFEFETPVTFTEGDTYLIELR